MKTRNGTPKSSSSVAVYGSLLLNIVSSVGVILVNKKLVYMEANFRFGTLLTIIHFIVCFLGCCVFAKFGFFPVKSLKISQVIPISLAFCGYVVFNNLSLLTNTVSVYQTSKIICTPLILWIEYMYYHKRESTSTLLSLIPVCLGVGITVFSDANLSLMGTIWTVLAIVSNSLYTIWGKTKQSELGATPMQLLLYQAPLSSFMLLFAIPLDGVEEITSYEVTFATVWTIALSCIFAFGVNFSFFLFVGQTSPLTMNIVGYLKTALVFIGGFFLLSSEATIRAICGVTLTLVGLAMYTYSKLNATTSKAQKRDII